MINKSTKYNNLDELSYSNYNKYFFIDSIFEFDGFTTKERKIIHKKCSYICNICKNDYMFTCPECEFAKEFEFEIEKQRYMKNVKNVKKSENKNTYTNTNTNTNTIKKENRIINKKENPYSNIINIYNFPK